MADRAWRAGLLSSFIFILTLSGVAPCLSVTRIRITIHNDAGAPKSVLTQAADEASRIFQKAGVDSVWIVCQHTNAGASSPPDCLSRVDLTHVSLRIVPWSAQLGDSIFGSAFLSEKGMGVYGDVFYPSAEKLHNNCDASVSRVLGHVMAHEIGHLLLGTNSHSALGIMRPHWQAEELRQIGMGTLLFTPDQARKMQVRLLSMLD